ncbi:Site-specific recombinase XerD [Thermoplasmatales archaeon]|nr:Site-specific recombinase XerD [Thermoplasmatales archaeon]
MTYDDLHSTLKKTLRRAGIKRRIYPHLFRHTRATILASRATEAPLETQMDWMHVSRMTQTYLHLSGRDHNMAILKVYGIEVKEDSSIDSERPLNCPRCNEPNDKITRF